MANLTAQYPDLNKMFGGMSMLPAQLGMEQYNTARGNEQINQSGALQDMYQKGESHPLDMEQKRLTNRTSEAMLPGFEADSGLKQDKAQVSRGTLPQQEAAMRSKLIADMSDDDVKTLGNQAQQLAMSRDPTERTIGTELLKQHKDVIAEKEKQRYMSDRLAAQERLAQEGRMALAKENNAAGRYKKGGAILSIEEQMNSGKLSYEKGAVLLNNAAYMAEMDGDEEKATQYRNLANQYATKAEQLKRAGAAVPPAGTPALQELGVPVNPNVPSTPLQSPAAAAQPASAAQTAGDRVRVINKDGKAGTIPRSQLQQAISQGFKEAQ